MLSGILIYKAKKITEAKLYHFDSDQDRCFEKKFPLWRAKNCIQFWLHSIM